MQTASVLEATPSAIVSITPAVTPKVKVTQAQVDDFARAIINGQPTAKILPARISDCDLDALQKAQIKDARKIHELAARQSKKDVLAELRANRWGMVAYRSNAVDSRRTLRFVDDTVKSAKRSKKTNAQ